MCRMDYVGLSLSRIMTCKGETTMTKKIHDALMIFLFIVCGIMLASLVICAEPTEVAAAKELPPKEAI